jgi:hypothetical protein
MLRIVPDIAKDLYELQQQIRDLERAHKELFNAVFVSKAISRYDGIALIVKNGQQLQELYRQERALAKMNR